MTNGIVLELDTRKQWSNYWRQGHLTSLPCGFSSNYDGEFLAFWQRQFALLGTGSRILDVCSGNGAIALLAQDYSVSNQLALNVTAIDAADIDVTAVSNNNPDIARLMQGITFLPNTPVETLSKTMESVDLVTSQYGIEYSDWEQSASQVSNLLKMGGYFSCVSHSSDSTVITRMEHFQRDYAKLVSLELFREENEYPQSQDGCIDFIRQLDDTLDKAYAMFQADRRSSILSDAGREMERIRQQTLKDFNAGFQLFTQFQQDLLISYATATDLLSVNHRLAARPNWFELFCDYGLELLQSGDIHYHTGERAGKYHQFRKPT